MHVIEKREKWNEKNGVLMEKVQCVFKFVER